MPVPSILLVDDELALRAALRRIVRSLGYEALDAEDAGAALALVDAGARPTAAVVDYMMPGTGGVSLARSLRARRPDLPVLLLSGGTRNAEIEAALAEGVLWDYGTKPWELAWMRVALAALVAGEPPPR